MDSNRVGRGVQVVLGEAMIACGFAASAARSKPIAPPPDGDVCVEKDDPIGANSGADHVPGDGLTDAARADDDDRAGGGHHGPRTPCALLGIDLEHGTTLGTRERAQVAARRTRLRRPPVQAHERDIGNARVGAAGPSGLERVAERRLVGSTRNRQRDRGLRHAITRAVCPRHTRTTNAARRAVSRRPHRVATTAFTANLTPATMR